MGNPAIVELPTEKDLTQCILEIAKAIIGVTDDSIRQQVQIRKLQSSVETRFTYLDRLLNL